MAERAGSPEAELQRLRTELAAFARDHPDTLACAYLFGSAARGETAPLSDLDVAVLFASPVTRAERDELVLELAGRLQRPGGPRVDVTVLEEAPPALRHRVVRDGRILLCLDEPCRIAFETRALREFLDFQPLLDRYDAALLRRTREGRVAR